MGNNAAPIPHSIFTTFGPPVPCARFYWGPSNRFQAGGLSWPAARRGRSLRSSAHEPNAQSYSPVFAVKIPVTREQQQDCFDERDDSRDEGPAEKQIEQAPPGLP
jgi:hypothetical protein